MLQPAHALQAVIDFRAELPPEITLRTLAAFPDGLSTEFPQRHERRSLQAQIEILKDSSSRIASPVERPDGYILRRLTNSLLFKLASMALRLVACLPTTMEIRFSPRRCIFGSGMSR
jgi:hypothetical protein